MQNVQITKITVTKPTASRFGSFVVEATTKIQLAFTQYDGHTTHTESAKAACGKASKAKLKFEFFFDNANDVKDGHCNVANGLVGVWHIKYANRLSKNDGSASSIFQSIIPSSFDDVSMRHLQTIIEKILDLPMKWG